MNLRRRSKNDWGRLDMRFNLWEDCNRVPLTELLSFIVDNRGKTVPTAPSGHKLIATNCVTNNTLFPVYEKIRYLSEETYQTWFRAHPIPGDILFVNKGTPGRVCLVPDPVDFCIAQDMIALRADESKIYPKYLFAVLRSREIQQQIYNTNVGDVIPHFKKQFLNQLLIPIPERSIQESIGDLYYVLSLKAERNKKINDNLQQQAQALFKQWFVDNPDAISWKEGTFSNLIEKTISGDWGKDSPSGNNTEMVYCIRGADIPEVRAGNKGKMPTRYILPKNYAVKQLVDGDIVVEISGGSPTQSTGRAAAVSDALLARYDKGMVCTNFCKALKPRAGYSMYVYYYWQYLYDRDIFFSYENGTTGIKNLDINGFIETEPIVIAPEGLVEKFDAVCQTVFSKIYANGMENEHLALVRDTLLPKLMSGEIDASAVQL